MGSVGLTEQHRLPHLNHTVNLTWIRLGIIFAINTYAGYSVVMVIYDTDGDI